MKQKRKEKEGKNKAAWKDNPYPGWDALKKEAREEPPAMSLVIRDPQGNIVYRLAGSTSKGIHRTTWNMRYSGSAGRFGGPLAPPGKIYRTRRVVC